MLQGGSASGPRCGAKRSMVVGLIAQRMCGYRRSVGGRRRKYGGRRVKAKTTCFYIVQAGLLKAPEAGFPCRGTRSRGLTCVYTHRRLYLELTRCVATASGLLYGAPLHCTSRISLTFVYLVGTPRRELSRTCSSTSTFLCGVTPLGQHITV